MFINITIHLAGPICDCAHQDLSWRIERVDTREEVELHDLLIECRICHESLLVEHDDFIAAIELEEKYPKGLLPTKQKKKTLVLVKAPPEPEKEAKVSNVISFLSFFKGKKKDKDPDTENDKTPP